MSEDDLALARPASTAGRGGLRRLLLCLTATGLLTACQAVPQRRAVEEVDRAIADKGGFLYEVTSPQRPDEHVYLFGVIHYDKIFDAGQPHLMIKPSAWHRIVASRRLFVESVAAPARTQPPPAALAAAVAAPGKDVDLHALAEDGAGELQSLYAACGYSLAGADVQAALFAVRSGKKILGLESAADRERILGAIGDEEKRNSAAYRELAGLQRDAGTSVTALGHVGKGSDGSDGGECAAIEATWRAWKTEDVAAIEQQLAQASSDPFMHYLIDERNVLFHQRIRQHLAEQNKGTMFVAIGTLHLFGERGLLALFAAEGYTVSRVP